MDKINSFYWHDRGTVRTRAAPGPHGGNYWLLNWGPARQLSWNVITETRCSSRIGRFKSCRIAGEKFPRIVPAFFERKTGNGVETLVNALSATIIVDDRLTSRYEVFVEWLKGDEFREKFPTMRTI